MRMPSRAIRAARRCAISSIDGGCLSIVHGFLLLVMRKPAGFQAAKNRRKKRLRPSLVSARVGIVKSLALTELQFL